MKFPYDISYFKEINTQNYFYCDRTHMIPIIEDTCFYPIFSLNKA
jgi:hypothetical protein